MLHKLAMLHIEHSLDIHTVNNLFLSENIPEKYKKVFIIFSYIRVLIIASCFANYEVNSSNCDCKVVNHTKNTKQFFPKENLIHLDHTLPHYIHILFIHYMLLLVEILLILNITLENAKNDLQFWKQNFRLWRAKCFATLSIFIAKWISKDNSNAVYDKAYSMQL